MTEPNTWQDVLDSYSESISNPQAGAAGASVSHGFSPHFMMPDAVQHPLQETQTFHWPYPSGSQFPPTYPQCPPEPQLSHDLHFMSPVRGQQDFLSDPWFLNDPVLSSLMAVDLHSPAEPPHRPFLDEPTDAMIKAPQPVVRSTDEFADLCEPERIFVTLENVQSGGDDGRTQAGPLNLSLSLGNMESPSLPFCCLPDESLSTSADQDNRAACFPNETRREVFIKKTESSSERSDGGSKPTKRCNCLRSKCLKLYCSCFASGEMCSNCNCANCHNNTIHGKEREKAVKLCLGRDPHAFGSKDRDDNSKQIRVSRNKGCNCKHTGCLKNYCECFKAKIKCSPGCNCVGCRNYDKHPQRKVEEELHENQPKGRSSLLERSAIEAECERLMLRAALAQRDLWIGVSVEHMILKEFGLYLKQISNTMLK